MAGTVRGRVADMERMGLVSQVEAELERRLSLDLLPEDRSLPSEHKLARTLGVSRGTVREALRRLSARGLVVQHPGRRTRAVPLDEALTLESLSVALDEEGRLRPGRLRLLEGYLALKRELTVELLVACCEKASPAALEELAQACFALGDTAHWDEGEGQWVRQDFALLRQAACSAERMGHVLLIQSLERAFRGMASWVLPLLDSKAVRPWALCAMNALMQKDVQALKQQLPALLQVGDERLLCSLAPKQQPVAACAPPPSVAEPPPGGDSMSSAERGSLAEEVFANLSSSRTGLCEVPPAGDPPAESVYAGTCHGPAHALSRERRPPGTEGNLTADPPAPPVEPGGRLLEPSSSSLPAAGLRRGPPPCCSGSDPHPGEPVLHITAADAGTPVEMEKQGSYPKKLRRPWSASGPRG
jgi:GntR family transcriptional repressor for pyruvate dehydrogenase complex